MDDTTPILLRYVGAGTFCLREQGPTGQFIRDRAMTRDEALAFIGARMDSGMHVQLLGPPQRTDDKAEE